MTQICVVGQHFWSRRLCDTLQRYVPAEVRSHTLHLSNIAAPRTRSALQQADLLVRVGYRPGARTIMGRSFDAFWNLLRTITRHPPVVHYWLGSDVFRTVRDHAGGKLRTRVFESIMNDHHLADAPWLAEELAQVGIRSTVMHIPAPNLRSAEVTPLPEQFSVLTYIPDTRFAFYGGNSIYQAAANLPDIQFVIVGGNGRWVRGPLPNLRFMGWQNDLTPFYQESSVVLRIVEHDSIGVTVKEALSFGRHVIYSYPLPHTLHVPFNHAAKLTSALNDLHTLHKRHLLLPNTSGWSYALQEFNEARDARQFAEYIHQIVKTGRS